MNEPDRNTPSTDTRRENWIWSEVDILRDMLVDLEMAYDDFAHGLRDGSEIAARIRAVSDRCQKAQAGIVSPPEPAPPKEVSR